MIPLRLSSHHHAFDGKRRTIRKRTRFYIAGPIQGFESRQGYRARIRDLLIKAGVEVFDPWEEEKGRNKFARSYTSKQAQELIRTRLRQIERCQGVVAYLPKDSAGTLYELIWAKIHGKKIYIICPMEKPSPWVVGLTRHYFSSLAEFESEIPKVK